MTLVQILSTLDPQTILIGNSSTSSQERRLSAAQALEESRQAEGQNSCVRRDWYLQDGFIEHDWPLHWEYCIVKTYGGQDVECKYEAARAGEESNA